jgi:hypothetical protein
MRTESPFSPRQPPRLHCAAAAGLSAFQIEIVTHDELMDVFEIRSVPPGLGVGREVHRRYLFVELQLRVYILPGISTAELRLEGV